MDGDHVAESDSSGPAYVPVPTAFRKMKDGCFCSEQCGSRRCLARRARMRSKKGMRLRPASVEHSSGVDGIESFGSSHGSRAKPENFLTRLRVFRNDDSIFRVRRNGSAPVLL